MYNAPRLLDPIVELVLNFNPAWVNAQDGRGQTPLHLAAALNRVDIVALFLLQDSVDDMIRDFMGKTAADVAGGPDTSTLISGACAGDIKRQCMLSFRSLTQYLRASRNSSLALSLQRGIPGTFRRLCGLSRFNLVESTVDDVSNTCRSSRRSLVV